MKKKALKIVFLFFCLFVSILMNGQSQFVKQKNGQFYLDGKPYYYLGTNYWYGSILGLMPDKKRGFNRLRKELDILVAHGIKNIRVIAGIEGSGIIAGVERVGPPLQTEKGIFNDAFFKGLDLLIVEMNKRNMKGVFMLSNNWEWSGGFLQYLQWNEQIQDSIFRNKMDWEVMRDEISKFYTCDACKQDYLKQLSYILTHTNAITHRSYVNEPAIMAWELANEPRPMRPSSINAYKKWINDVADFIRSRDKHHLITTGAEGYIGTENIDVYEVTHANKNIDYLTIHIWPKNWGWYKSSATMESEFPEVLAKTKSYIEQHIEIAKRLSKPLVIEEFGYPRDNNAFYINSSTQLRDKYYESVFNIWEKSRTQNGVIGGVSFWAFNGISRPITGQTFWKKGDDYMGDPPMEEQGLYGVFNSDLSTLNLIRKYTKPTKFTTR